MSFFAHDLIFPGKVIFLVAQSPHTHILILASISAYMLWLYRQLVVADGWLQRLILLNLNFSHVVICGLSVQVVDIAVLDRTIVPSLARSVQLVQVLLTDDLLEVAICLQLFTRLIDLRVLDEAVFDVRLPHRLDRLLDLQSIDFLGLDALLLGGLGVVGLALDLLSMLARVESLAQMLRSCQ